MRTLTIPQKRDRAIRIAVQILVVVGILWGAVVARYYFS